MATGQPTAVERSEAGTERPSRPTTTYSTMEPERMDIFEMMAVREHEQILFWSEPSIGYRGIIAIHDTTLGPALGGTRFWSYGSDRDALVDVLRLSRGMRWSWAKILQQAGPHQNEPFGSLPLAVLPDPCLAPFFSES